MHSFQQMIHWTINHSSIQFFPNCDYFQIFSKCRQRWLYLVESQTAQMVQANWQSPEMPLEYSRQTKVIAVNMVHGLVRKIRKGWRPGDLKGSKSRKDESSSDDEELQERAFFVRKDLKTSPTVRPATEVKYHLQDRKDPTILACNIHVQVSNCEPMGAYAPEERMICSGCMRKRKDLFWAYEKAWYLGSWISSWCWESVSP